MNKEKIFACNWCSNIGQINNLDKISKKWRKVTMFQEKFIFILNTFLNLPFHELSEKVRLFKFIKKAFFRSTLINSLGWLELVTFHWCWAIPIVFAHMFSLLRIKLWVNSVNLYTTKNFDQSSSNLKRKWIIFFLLYCAFFSGVSSLINLNMNNTKMKFIYNSDMKLLGQVNKLCKEIYCSCHKDDNVELV